ADSASRVDPGDVAQVVEADPAGEQLLRAAARSETEKGSLGQAGLPFRAVRRVGHRRGLVEFGAPAAPDVDDDEQEQPDDVDKVTVPRTRLQTEALLRREEYDVSASPANDSEDRT